MSENNQNRRADGTYAPKRYVGSDHTITVEMTDFEAMFIAQRLWEIGEWYDDNHQSEIEKECKWWSRKLHSERRTRE